MRLSSVWTQAYKCFARAFYRVSHNGTGEPVMPVPMFYLTT